jgi:hypothetical protein
MLIKALMNLITTRITAILQFKINLANCRLFISALSELA